MSFLIKFLLTFCLCYYGTLAVIGLAAPEDYYSPFVDEYLNYVGWIKASLVSGTKFLLSLFGISTVREAGYLIRIVNARGVIIAMDCVGYGVYSFWIAFIVANTVSISTKIKWIAAGILVLWSINVIRISLFLVAINKKWAMPLGIDHHTWFNIAAYLLIFAMIFLFNKQTKKSDKALSI